MIGRGGQECKRADHGIASTEAGRASFLSWGQGEHDFGDGRPKASSVAYSLNLLIN